MRLVKPIDEATLISMIQSGAKKLAIALNSKQIELLIAYLYLLLKWNVVYNLTAVRDPEQMVVRHLLDSLSVVVLFKDAHNILDVGAGGGLPGIVLAIVFPEKKFSLIDKVHKKTAFLKQVKAELNLDNVMIYTGAIEKLIVPEQFDVITSRAFSELNNFIMWSKHVLLENGCFIAMKGSHPDKELLSISPEWQVQEIKPLFVPGLQEQRHAVIVNRKSIVVE